MPSFSSSRAMSMGPVDALLGSISIGAPMAIWRALAPTILALSKRVSFGGPMVIFFSVPVSLEFSSVFSAP
jgi:hypothetical protein